jgi:hypothetical protein
VPPQPIVDHHPRRVMTAAGPEARMRTMPLHERETVNERLADCLYAGRDMTRPVPKYKFPRSETLPREAFQVVSDELILDGNARLPMRAPVRRLTSPYSASWSGWA